MREFVPMTDDMLERRSVARPIGALPMRRSVPASASAARAAGGAVAPAGPAAATPSKRARSSALDGQHVARLGAELLGHAGIELENVLRRAGGRVLRAGSLRHGGTRSWTLTSL